MNTWVLRGAALLATAVVLTLGATAAFAQTVLAKQGNYTIAVADDMQTCLMLTSDDSTVMILAYNGSSNEGKLLLSNDAYRFQDKGGYTITVNADGRTFNTEGEGLANSETSGVMLSASDGARLLSGLEHADKVSFSTSNGTVIYTINSDTDYETASGMLRTCGDELAK